jgi:CRISPR-associated exonuclease Cas4
MTYWINPDRGELFFAKKVVLVEGQTDKSVIAYLAKQLGCFRYDYTLIDCGSKENMPLYIHLLNSFKLPYVVVYDKDHQPGKDKDAIACADASTDRITAKIDSGYGLSIVLENDIEEEIGITDINNKNKPHVAMEFVSDTSFKINPNLATKIDKIFS